MSGKRCAAAVEETYAHARANAVPASAHVCHVRAYRGAFRAGRQPLGADGPFLPCFSLAAAAQESVEEREARLRAEEADEEDEEMEEGEEGAASGRGQSRMVRRVGRRGRCVWVGA